MYRSVVPYAFVANAFIKAAALLIIFYPIYDSRTYLKSVFFGGVNVLSGRSTGRGNSIISAPSVDEISEKDVKDNVSTAAYSLSTV